MFYKSRTEPADLFILKSLATRKSLSPKEEPLYFALNKGFEGEILFDSLTEKLQCECLILNDLLLKQNSTFFQIDSLIITSDTIFVFEVKNYEGDYYYEADKLYKIPKTEITNPLNQLNRSESLLRQFIQTLGFNLPIKANVVFINPEFTLYQTPLNKPFVLPTQIHRYLRKLDQCSSNLKEKHKRLADKIISYHIVDTPFKLSPSYEYEQLQKGITCENCTSLSVFTKGTICVCHECGYEEAIETAMMRSVMEFKLLFPERKVTTNAIQDWCKIITSKKKIRRILGENFKMIGVHQWAYYE